MPTNSLTDRYQQMSPHHKLVVTVGRHLSKMSHITGEGLSIADLVEEYNKHMGTHFTSLDEFDDVTLEGLRDALVGNIQQACAQAEQVKKACDVILHQSHN